ncbi:MAG: glycosyl hydrolase [Luteolibacter sp.]|uniref:glycosyl hydrolase n=1 Tax=Luteolibacter sp. TaxID=1962973 RepID=UPI003263B089
MNHYRNRRNFLLSAFAFSSLAAAGESVIVPCDQPVKSKKRGVCVNEASAKDFMALSPGVSWYYTWHFKDTNHAPDAAKIKFLPMAWGDRPSDLAGLDEYLKSNKPSAVLAINEPNLKGQAFISPEATAELYQKIKAIADRHGVPVIGPHMALGSAEGDSITAMDPIDKKNVTYTFMTPFLKAFQHFAGKTEILAVAAHSYGNFGELKWMIGMMHKEFNRPVWVTEFNSWQASDPNAEIEYMIQSVDLMEREPYVQGYAWFKERAKDNAKISLLGKESGTLTELGNLYVNMPVHDPDIFYRMPGRIQAESYTTAQDPEIARTKDTDGLLEMKVLDSKSTLDYQLFCESGGTFPAKLRLATREGAKIELLSGERVLATFTGTSTGWQTLSTSISLPAGKSTVRLRPDSAARLNWIELAGK